MAHIIAPIAVLIMAPIDVTSIDLLWHLWYPL